MLVALLVPARTTAQGWVIDASAGRAVHGPVPSSIETTGATLSIRHEGARWSYLSAGAPFDSAGLPWGAAGLGGRFSAGAGQVSVGVDLAGHAFGYRDRFADGSGSGAIAEAMPLLSLSGAAARLDLRSGLQHHTRADTGLTTSRTLHASDARLTLGSGRVQVSGEGRYLRASEGDYPYAGAGFETSIGAGSVWGYAGKWFSSVVETPVWGVGASMPLGGRAEAYAAFAQETNDPLLWNAPRQSWSIGVNRRLGRAVASAPRAASIPVAEPGRVTFRLPADAGAQPPAVAGDFNGWNAVPMVRAGDSWILSLPLAPGVYHYAFRGADGKWFVPKGVPSTDDGFGGTSAVLVVR